MAMIPPRVSPDEDDDDKLGSSSSSSVALKSSDLLDCPTCSEPLKKPIYQCINGHVACSLCCTKLGKRCFFCTSRIGKIRCRAMEKVIEETIVSCPNAIYGCRETTSYDNLSNHEKLCLFLRCSCPLPNCNYIGSYTDLKSHARASHSWDEDQLIPFVFGTPQVFLLDINKMAVFQEEKEGDLIVVQASKGSHGMYVTLSCVAPMSPQVRDLSCDLSCSSSLYGFNTLRLGLMVRKIPIVREHEHPPRGGFMLIPNYELLRGVDLKLKICIHSEYN